jgi:hypothetical protein
MIIEIKITNKTIKNKIKKAKKAKKANKKTGN